MKKKKKGILSFCQHESTGFSGGLRERVIRLIRIRGYATVPLGWWFLLSAEPDIHLLSETPKSPHRRLSLCSRQSRNKPKGASGVCLHRSARHMRDLAACAADDPDIFPSWGGFHAAGSAAAFSRKHEVLFPALHCDHVGDHLPGYGKRRPVLVPSLASSSHRVDPIFPFLPDARGQPCPSRNS